MDRSVDSAANTDRRSIVQPVGWTLFSWATLFIGLTSFGPGDVWVTVPVMALAGAGWWFAPFRGGRSYPRSLVAVSVAVGCVVGGLAAVYTPPSGDELLEELEVVATESGAIPPLDAYRLLRAHAPWAVQGGSLVAWLPDRDQDAAARAMVSALEDRGYEVRILRPELGGLDTARQRGQSVWDLVANKDRTEIRAAFAPVDGAPRTDVMVQIGWHPFFEVDGAFDEGASGFVAGLLGAAVAHWLAVVVGSIGGFLGLLATAWLLGAFWRTVTRSGPEDRGVGDPGLVRQE